MHDVTKAAGYMLELSPSTLVAHIVDSEAVLKVKHGIYSRLECGGRIKRDSKRPVHHPGNRPDGILARR